MLLDIRVLLKKTIEEQKRRRKYLEAGMMLALSRKRVTLEACLMATVIM